VRWRDDRLRAVASISHVARLTTGMDDKRKGGLRLLLLGKGAVFAHRFERSLTAQMDEKQHTGASAEARAWSAAFA
jgi:hypothetical protein